MLREQELLGVPTGSLDHTPDHDGLCAGEPCTVCVAQVQAIRAAVRVYYIGLPGSKAAYWWPEGQVSKGGTSW